MLSDNKSLILLTNHNSISIQKKLVKSSNKLGFSASFGFSYFCSVSHPVKKSKESLGGDRSALFAG
jgi:hypothetical protein